MRIRHDPVFISSVFFTIAFVCLVPPNWHIAQAGHNKVALADMGPGFADYARLLGQVGVGSLGIVLAALIIIWKGYIKSLRWTWFVMLVIVWVWAFPMLVLPYLSFAWRSGLHLILLARVSVVARDVLEEITIFSLMLIALILPVRTFFRKQPTAGGSV